MVSVAKLVSFSRSLKLLMLVAIFAPCPLYGMGGGEVQLSADAGMFLAPVIGAGMTLSLASESRYSVEFAGFSGKVSTNRRDVQVDYYAFRVKRQWWHSLYTNTGFGFRSVSDETLPRVSEDFIVKRRGEAFGLEAAVGQRWRKGNMVFGCDWLGYFLPVMHNHRGGIEVVSLGTRLTEVESPRNPRPLLDDFIKSYDADEAAWSRIAKHGQLQFIKLYLGIVF